MEIFKDIYSKPDSKTTPEQMWIAVMAHSSSIGESIRKFSFESLLNSTSHTFCWLCSFVNKCNTLDDDIFSIKGYLPEIVSLKYPMVCGHCQGKPCNCDPVKMERQKDKSAMYKQLLERRKRILASFQSYCIEDSCKEFDDIYGGRIHIQSLENIGYHFMEEIGEAAVCIRQLSQLREITKYSNTKIDVNFIRQLSTIEGIVNNYVSIKPPKDINYASRNPNMLKARVVEAKMGLVIEIGDSFSWFCSILNKLNSISLSIYDHPKEHPEILKPLETVLKEEYLDSSGQPRCPSCKRSHCECVFYNVTTRKRQHYKK